tara:strand:- start:1302 stop:1532 length:231 start_codon:yes stop_codon:yes gene_type:complete
MSNVVTNSNRDQYLSSKSWAFKSGFLAAEDGDTGFDSYPCKLNIASSVKKEWNAGYEAAMANSYTTDGTTYKYCAL